MYLQVVFAFNTYSFFLSFLLSFIIQIIAMPNRGILVCHLERSVSVEKNLWRFTPLSLGGGTSKDILPLNDPVILKEALA